MATSRYSKNNMVAMLALVAASTALTSTHVSAAALLSFAPSPTVTAVGGTLTLDVTITGIADLYGYDYSIGFDPTAVRLTGASEGAFVGKAGNTYYASGAVDNAAGTYSFSADSLLSAVPGASGSGVLERITFSVLSSAPATFSFSGITFLDSKLDEISVTAIPLTVTAAVPEPATWVMFGLGLAGVLARRRRAA